MNHHATGLVTMRAGALAVIVMLVGGCMVGPDYVRPTAPTSPAFKESEGWKPAQPSDDAPRGAWWEVFGDADLNALEREVDISNQTVQAAEAQLRNANAAIQAARAGLFPAVNANAAATRSSRGSSGNAGTAGGSSGVANNYNLAVDAS